MMGTNGHRPGFIDWIRQRGRVAMARKWLSEQHVVLGLAVVVAILIMVANELNFRAAGLAEKDSAEVALRQTAIYDLQRLLLDAETGQRGYLLTGDASYLKPYTQAVESVESSLNSLRGLVRSDGRQIAEFSTLSRAISRKLAELELTIALRRSGAEHEPWQTVMNTGLGSQYMDAVRAASDTLLKSAAKDLNLQSRKFQQSLLASRLSLMISALFGLLAFCLYFRGSNRLQESSKKRAQDLQQEKARLENLVAMRTAELERLATHLIQVQESERERLARELHDELGSLLTAAKFDVARVKSRLPADTLDLQERLSKLTSTLNSGIAVKRKIIENLRPSSLSNLGLRAALEILTQEFIANTQIPVDIGVDDVELNDEQQLAIYRLVQEAFTNVAKHAQAKQVQVLVKNYFNQVEVVVSDDGVGFDPGLSKLASHGLSGMRHRMHALKGRLDLNSAPGRGTTITATLPLALGSVADASAQLTGWIQPGMP